MSRSRPGLNRLYDLGLGRGVVVHVLPPLSHEGSLRALVQSTIPRITAEVIAQKQILRDRNIPAVIDVHVNIALWRADEAMSGFTHTQLITDSQKLVEVVLFGSDVIHTYNDVDDRLGCQSGDRGGADVFDQDVLPCQRLADPSAMMEKDVCPCFVITAQLHL